MAPQTQTPTKDPLSFDAFLQEHTSKVKKDYGINSPGKEFGAPRPDHTHEGIDLPGNEGDSVEAGGDGKVIFRGVKKGYGNIVILLHPDGTASRYAHLKDFQVEQGDLIKKGVPIGRVGRTGNAKGPHVHYERRDSQGLPIDPYHQDFFPTIGGKLNKAIQEDPYSLDNFLSETSTSAKGQGVQTASGSAQGVAPTIPAWHPPMELPPNIYGLPPPGNTTSFPSSSTKLSPGKVPGTMVRILPTATVEDIYRQGYTSIAMGMGKTAQEAEQIGDYLTKRAMERSNGQLFRAGTSDPISLEEARKLGQTSFQLDNPEDQQAFESYLQTGRISPTGQTTQADMDLRKQYQQETQNLPFGIRPAVQGAQEFAAHTESQIANVIDRVNQGAETLGLKSPDGTNLLSKASDYMKNRSSIMSDVTERTLEEAGEENPVDELIRTGSNTGLTLAKLYTLGKVSGGHALVLDALASVPKEASTAEALEMVGQALLLENGMHYTGPAGRARNLAIWTAIPFIEERLKNPTGDPLEAGKHAIQFGLLSALSPRQRLWNGKAVTIEDLPEFWQQQSWGKPPGTLASIIMKGTDKLYDEPISVTKGDIISHPKEGVDGQPAVGVRADGKVVVANEKNKGKVSVVKPKGKKNPEKEERLAALLGVDKENLEGALADLNVQVQESLANAEKTTKDKVSATQTQTAQGATAKGKGAKEERTGLFMDPNPETAQYVNGGKPFEITREANGKLFFRKEDGTEDWIRSDSDLASRMVRLDKVEVDQLTNELAPIKKEVESNATPERQVPAGNQPQYKGGEGSREATETSRSDSFERSREVQEPAVRQQEAPQQGQEVAPSPPSTPITSRETFSQSLQRARDKAGASNLTDEHIEASSLLADAAAESWARRNNQPKEEFYTRFLSGVEGGGDIPAEALLEEAWHGTRATFEPNVEIRNKETGRTHIVTEQYWEDAKDTSGGRDFELTGKTFPKGRFSTDFIGTGEGNQTFGWGMYFAGKKKLAEYYRNQGTRGSHLIDLRIDGESINNYVGNKLLQGSPLPDEIARTLWNSAYSESVRTKEDLLSNLDYNRKHHAKIAADALETARKNGEELPQTQAAIDSAEYYNQQARGQGEISDQYLEAFNYIKDRDVEVVRPARKGAVYKVDLKRPHDGDWLLWDVPFSEQNRKVKEALLNSPIGEQLSKNPNKEVDTKTRSEVMRHFRSFVDAVRLHNDALRDRYELGLESPQSKGSSPHASHAARIADLEGRITRIFNRPNTRAKDLFIAADNLNSWVEYYTRSGNMFLDEISPELTQPLHDLLDITDTFKHIERYSNPTGADIYEMLKAHYEGDTKRSEALSFQRDANWFNLRSDKRASQELARLGIPGHKFLNGRSRGSKSENPEDFNYVIYSEEAIEILDRLEQKGRGATQFLQDGKAIIHVLESADASTLPHELAHIFRRTLAPEDALHATQWVDGKDSQHWDRAAEEKFATGFEKYLREGKAPTEQLAKVFSQFKKWLHSVYSKLKGSPIEQKLTPEIRAVFDRMLGAEKRGPDRMAQAEFDALSPEEQGKLRSFDNVPISPEQLQSTQDSLDLQEQISQQAISTINSAKIGDNLYLQSYTIPNGHARLIRKEPVFGTSDSFVYTVRTTDGRTEQFTTKDILTGSTSIENIEPTKALPTVGKLSKSSDFKMDGIWNVPIGEVPYQIYRDSNTGYWRISEEHLPPSTKKGWDAVSESTIRDILSTETRKEAIEELRRRVAEGKVQPIKEEPVPGNSQKARQYNELLEMNAPDVMYRRLFSTGTKNPLKKGETWKQRAKKYADSEAKKEAAQKEEEVAKREDPLSLEAFQAETSPPPSTTKEAQEASRMTDQQLQETLHYFTTDRVAQRRKEIASSMRTTSDPVEKERIERQIDEQLAQEEAATATERPDMVEMRNRSIEALQSEIAKRDPTPTEQASLTPSQISDLKTTIDRLHSHRARTEGLTTASSTVANSFFKQLDEAAKRFAPTLRDKVMEAKKAWAVENDTAKATLLSEQVVSGLHGRLSSIYYENGKIVDLKGFGSTNRIVTTEGAVKAKQDIKNLIKPGQLHDISELVIRAGSPLVKLGAYYLEGGVREFTAWAKRLAEDLTPEQYESIKPFLNDLYAASKQHIDATYGPLAVKKVRSLMRQAAKSRQLTEEAYTEERGKRLGQFERRVEKGGAGEKAVTKAFGALKGELPSDAFEPIRKQITQQEADSLYSMIANSTLGRWEKVSAYGGLRNLLNPDVSIAPTRSELLKLQQVYGRGFVKDLINMRKGLGEKVWEEFLSFTNIPRTIMASFDLSAPFRQGLILSTSHPIVASRAFQAMVKAYGSESYADQVMRSIEDSPFAKIREKANLYQSHWGAIGDDLAAKEEFYAVAGKSGEFLHNIDRWVEGAFSVKVGQYDIGYKGIAASERAYLVYLNKLRADVFDNVVRANPKASNEQLEAVATFINYASGRGSLALGPLGSLEKAAPLLNNLFFSPRFFVSRFQAGYAGGKGAISVVAGGLTGRGSSIASKLAARALVANVGAGLSFLGLLAAAGVEVGMDPLSSDFGKIKVGSTRVDIWGGMQQPARYIAQFMMAERTPISGKGREKIARGETVERFFRSKESPQASLVHDIFLSRTKKIGGEEYGTDFLGKPTTFAKGVRERVLPLFHRDIYEAIQEDRRLGGSGLIGGSLGSLGFFGIGVQTIPPKNIEYDPFGDASTWMTRQ